MLSNMSTTTTITTTTTTTNPSPQHQQNDNKNNNNNNKNNNNNNNDYPFMRYTNPSPPPVHSGWLVKEGRTFRSPYARFFKLNPPYLLNFHNETDINPTWTFDLTCASLTLGSRLHEIIISSSSRKKPLHLFTPTRDDFRRWLYHLRRTLAFYSNDNKDMSHFYHVSKKSIGDGVNGDVLCGRDRATGMKVAVKSLPLVQTQRQVTEEEIRIAISLKHKNIVRTIDVFRDEPIRVAYLVMELISGGELRARVDNPTSTIITTNNTDMIDDDDNLTLNDVKYIAYDILSAVVYLHDRGIVHRDIKLENVLCCSCCSSSNSTSSSSSSSPNRRDNKTKGRRRRRIKVKLADFGSSTTITEMKPRLNSAVGTGYYLAPEIIKEEDYGRPVDLWACGVLLYITICKQLPFIGLDVEEYFENVLNTTVEFPEEDWNGVDQEAIDLISKLMEKDVDKRLTARQALKHPWLTDIETDDEEEDDNEDDETEDDLYDEGNGECEEEESEEGSDSRISKRAEKKHVRNHLNGLLWKRKTAADIVRKHKQR